MLPKSSMELNSRANNYFISLQKYCPISNVYKIKRTQAYVQQPIYSNPRVTLQSHTVTMKGIHLHISDITLKFPDDAGKPDALK